MPFHDLKQRLDLNAPDTLPLQLARLLAREILDGRFPAGSVLPGSQALAEELGLRRRTVMSALELLEWDGWLESKGRRGTYVADQPPSHLPATLGPLPEATGIPEVPAFGLPEAFPPSSTLAGKGMDLSEGLPDARLAPQIALARGYRRALQRHGTDLLGKGESRGNLALRENLAQYLTAHRAVKAKAENVFITRGTPMALDLIASALLPKGGHVAVENPGNPQAWEALRSVPGVSLHPIPVDLQGLDVEALAALISRQRIGMLYLTPQYQIPTTVALAPDRREILLTLARQQGFAIVEDDPEFDYHRPSGPLWSLTSSDTEGRVIHLGSLSHTLAPGLRLGFLVAPKTLVDRLARVRQRMDAQGDRVLEWAVADFIRDGDFERHLARTRKIYTERRQMFLDSIHEDLGPGFEAQDPEGGLACWVRVPDDLDLEAWSKACRNEGIKFYPGRVHEFEQKPLPFIRLGFACLEPAEMRSILQRMSDLR
jgi:GntR family transcriptional regulator / MocR family aminotransferase